MLGLLNLHPVVKRRKRTNRYREELNQYINNKGINNVYNLSSINIPAEDLFALELSHGFIPSPNNSPFEEETLILEGLRFIDRIGKIDTHLSTPGIINNGCSSPSPDNITHLNIVDSDHNFTRDKTIPATLKFCNLLKKILKSMKLK